jgi:hypothetical protein
MRIRRFGVTWAIVVAAAASVTPDVASAAPTWDIERVEAASVNDSSHRKEVSVMCPPGHQALGAWAMIDGAQGEVALKAVFPLATAVLGPNPVKEVVAVAAETVDTADLWRVRVFATCVELPLGGVEWEMTTSPSNSDAHKSATAACGEGKVVVGAGGAAMLNGKGAVILTAFYPDAGLTQVTAEASESVVYGANWEVSAFAVCAEPSLFDGLMVVTSALLPQSEFVWADCPSTTLDIGGGAAIVPENSRTPTRTTPAQVHMTSVASYSAVIPRSVGVAAEPTIGTSPEWVLQAFAICAVNLQS